MRIVALGFAVLCFAGTAFAQASDTPWQVRFWTSGGNSTIRVVNTGASATNPTNGTLCANLYAFNTSGQMTACCACPVTPNAMQSLSVTSNLVPLGTAPPSALVLKLLASTGSAGVCNPNTPGTGANVLATGLIGWLTGSQGEGSFVPSTLSAAELTKLQTQCTALNTPEICRTCPVNFN